MSVGVRKRKPITEAQYLKLERAAETKSEFLDGEVYAMTGASRQHNTITVNATVALHPQVIQRQCEIYTNDLRVKVSATGAYLYPDIAIACGGQFEDQEVDTLLNPRVIIEVLSKSTAALDRGEKFESYRKLDSLMEYLLVSQSRCHIEHYLRQTDGKWLLVEYDDPNDIIELPSIGCQLSLGTIYSRIALIIKEEGPTWESLREAR